MHRQKWIFFLFHWSSLCFSGWENLYHPEGSERRRRALLARSVREGAGGCERAWSDHQHRVGRGCRWPRRRGWRAVCRSCCCWGQGREEEGRGAWRVGWRHGLWYVWLLFSLFWICLESLADVSWLETAIILTRLIRLKLNYGLSIVRCTLWCPYEPARLNCGPN